VTTVRELEIFPQVEGVFQPFPFFPPSISTVHSPCTTIRSIRSSEPTAFTRMASSRRDLGRCVSALRHLIRQTSSGGPQVDPILKWTGSPDDRGFAEGLPKQGDRVPPGGIFVYTCRRWLAYYGWSLAVSRPLDLQRRHITLGAIGIIVSTTQRPSIPARSSLTTPTSRAAPQPAPRLTPSGHYRNSTYGKAQYLQLFHSLKGGGMLINGRKYLGQTRPWSPAADPDALRRRRYG